MILDGKPLAEKIKESVKREIRALGITPCLATVLVGDDPASKVYLQIKEKSCNEVGIKSVSKILPANSMRSNVIRAIEELNKDRSVHAILIQLPLPKHLDAKEIVEFIYPSKDVDGFHPMNMGRLVTEKQGIAPCTPMGIIELFKHYEIPLKGKNVAMVGHSMVVGKPMALLLLKEWATVDICHIETRDLASHTKRADIVIVAAGKPGLITADMVKEGVVIVDVGTTKVGDRVVGDVDFEAVKDKASAITPVPGGVGPMTVAMLMKNTLECAKKIENNRNDKK
jgi:methylenetetrahydrofolate dehydrogenase (NADP+)/methenyltetrahydrofolate cyclohydrolase